MVTSVENHRPRRRVPKPAVVLLLGLVVAAPLAVGGAWPVTPVVLAPIAALVLALALASRTQAPLPLVAVVPWAAALICLFQLAPWPPFLLGLWSPEARALNDFTVAPLGLSTWRPVSLDVPGTARALGFFFGLGVVAWVAWLAARASRSVRVWVPQVVAVLGAVLVLSAGVHALLGIEALFGLYQFRVAHPPLLTPFGNPNHLTSFLTLSGTLAVGLALEAKSLRLKALWLAAWVLAAAGVALSNSRAGIACFVLVQVAMVVLAVRRARGAEEKAWALRLGGAVGLGLLATPFVLWERLAERFGDVESALGKVTQWPHALTAMGDHWRTGVGRGAFELAFTRYYADHHGKTFTHPENLLLQWGVEVGVPAAALLLSLGAVAAWHGLKHRGGGALEAAAFLAAIGVVLHDVFDFGLELAGVAVPFAAVVGAAAGPLEGVPVRRVPVRLLAVPAVAVVALTLWLGPRFTVTAEQALERQVAEATTPEQVQAAALAAIDRHPADALLYAMAAQGWLNTQGDPGTALAYATRAQYLSPRDSAAHHLAAISLVRLGRRSQALGEYALALVTSPSPDALLADAVRHCRTSDDLWRLTSGGSAAALQVLRVGARPVGSRAAAEVAALALEANAPDPWSGELLQEGVLRYLGANDAPAAGAFLARFERRLPPEAVVLPKLTWLEASGRGDEALAMLQTAFKVQEPRFELTRALVERLRARQRHDEARAALKRGFTAVTATPERAELLMLEGSVLEGSGLGEAALEPLRSAVRLAPSVRSHSMLATAYERLGKREEAAAEVRAAGRLEGALDSPSYRTWLERLESPPVAP